METRRGRRRAGLLSFSKNKLPLLLCSCVFLFSLCALLNGKACLETRSSSASHSNPQRTKSRRQLIAGGPGSFPPRCAAKCGPCTPCFPVHIPVPPGIPVIEEYYPEAWRCKCGNRLYMP